MLRVDIEGLDKVRVRLGKIKENTVNLEPALIKSGAAVLESAQKHINEGGDPPWKPNVSGTPLLRKSQRLYDSLTQSAAGNVSQVNDFQIRVGTNVVSPKGFPYPRALQEGTGIYGPRAEAIKRKSRLNATLGAPGFKRESKGMPKRPYLYFDEKNTRAVARIFGDWILAKDVSGEADA